MTVNDTIDLRSDLIDAARTRAAAIDRPSVGWVVMRGADRLDLLQRLTTNDLANVRSGTGRHTVLLTDKARIIDVLTVLHRADETVLLCSAGNGGRVTQWLRNYIIMDDVKVADRSAEVRAVEWVGPRAADAIREAMDVDVSTLPMAHFIDHTVDGHPATTIRIPATCELAYITVITADPSAEIALPTPPMLSDAEAEYLRVLGGMGRLGAEWSDAYNPLEAGLLHMVSFAKGCYIGQEVVARLDSYNKVKQRVMGLVSDTRLTPGDVVRAEGADVGRVTSVVDGMRTPRCYALAYVRNEHTVDGTTVTVVTADGDVTATLRTLPMSES